jgi:hypothetical protein
LATAFALSSTFALAQAGGGGGGSAGGAAGASTGAGSSPGTGGMSGNTGTSTNGTTNSGTGTGTGTTGMGADRSHFGTSGTSSPSGIQTPQTGGSDPYKR